MQQQIRTDLAQEAYASVPQARGVMSTEEQAGEGISITRVKIVNQEGVDALGKPVGNYITIDVPRLLERDVDLEQRVIETLAREIRAMLGPIGEKDTVLVAGLGNREVTPDSLGPRVAAGTLVSRHITQYLPDLIDERVRPVCTVAPGVLGVTGIETGDVMKGLVQRVSPKVVIAVDALASRATDRISTVIQLTDTGIAPGGGVGNQRMELTQKTLGVPVIGIGVPTVVHASTISQDAVALLMQEVGEQEKEQALVELVGKIVSEKIGPLIVTPKEIDQIVADVSKVVAGGINLALHGVDARRAPENRKLSMNVGMYASSSRIGCEEEVAKDGSKKNPRAKASRASASHTPPDRRACRGRGHRFADLGPDVANAVGQAAFRHPFAAQRVFAGRALASASR